MTPTGLVTNKCYAAAYHDCDGRSATREHWISKALLTRIQHDGRGLRVSGLAWANGERDLQISDLASRVLCRRHNSILHNLDDTAIAFHDAWLAAGEGNRVHQVISGNGLERWALKVLAGMVSSGTARVNGIKARARIPRPILDVVFGLRGLPSPRGFYFVNHDERDEGMKVKVHTVPAGHALEGVALGISLQFLSFRYMTWLNAAAPTHSQLIHRPEGLDFGANGRITFQWTEGPASAVISLHLKISSP